MSDIAIHVENLGKLYRVGQFVGYKTIRESLTNAFSAPFHRLRSAVADPEPRTQEPRAMSHQPSATSYEPSAISHEPSAISHQPSAMSHQPSANLIWALKDVSFEVKQGEAIGIIGRNGSGKTTLLKILTRITNPTEGYAEIRGRAGSLLEVGTGFHPELTGRENIYLNGAVLGMKKKEIDRRFDEIVDFSGVEKFLDTPVKRYSSGMQVRLAFSVAAHLEPEILLVDEVLAVGDAEFQKKCLGKMGDVAKGGRTVLFVSHNMNAIQNLCESAILLKDGRIQTIGNTRETIDEYLAETLSVSSASLAQRTDRKGTGELLFTNVKFQNFRGEELEKLSSGEDTKIVVDYVCKDNKQRKSVWIGIQIHNSGAPVINFDTKMTNGDFERVPSKGQIICNIPKLPLPEGDYSIELFAACNGAITDWINDVANFHVMPGDFFKTGKPLVESSSRILVEHNWQIHE